MIWARQEQANRHSRRLGLEETVLATGISVVKVFDPKTHTIPAPDNFLVCLINPIEWRDLHDRTLAFTGEA
ncbi:MAG: hypothetical protein AAGC81_18580 [Pseudomonadota bacterium]